MHDDRARALLFHCALSPLERGSSLAPLPWYRETFLACFRLCFIGDLSQYVDASDENQTDVVGGEGSDVLGLRNSPSRFYVDLVAGQGCGFGTYGP